MVFYQYNEMGLFIGTTEEDGSRRTLKPYPQKMGFFRFSYGNWQPIFGADADGNLTLDPKKMADVEDKTPELFTTTFNEDSAYGRVEVDEGNKGGKVMYIDGWPVIGPRDFSVTTLGLESHIKGKVAACGLGGGNDARAIDSFAGVDSFDVIEINPVVVEASKLFGSLDWAKGTLVMDDATKYFGKPETPTYDVIISDIEDSSRPHAAAMIFEEALQDIKSKLVPGGLFVYWAGDLQSQEARTAMLNTMAAVFGHVGILEHSFVGSDSTLVGEKWVATAGQVNTRSNPILVDLQNRDQGKLPIYPYRNAGLYRNKHYRPDGALSVEVGQLDEAYPELSRAALDALFKSALPIVEASNLYQTYGASNVFRDYAIYKMGDTKYLGVGFTWIADNGRTFNAKVVDGVITDYYEIFTEGHCALSEIDGDTLEPIADYVNGGDTKIDARTKAVLQENYRTEGVNGLPSDFAKEIMDRGLYFANEIFYYAEKPYGTIVEFSGRSSHES